MILPCIKGLLPREEGLVSPFLDFDFGGLRQVNQCRLRTVVWPI